MPKVSKYEQRFAMRNQAKKAGIPYEPPRQLEKAFLSPQESAKAAENKLKPVPETSDTKRVIFLSRNDASGFQYRSGDAIISITDTHAEPPHFFRKPDDVEVLHRGFHDHVSIRSEAQGDRWCRIEDGEAIVEFINKHKDAKTIVVHCNMGQSRSKAAAIVIGEITGRLVKRYNRYGELIAYRDDGDQGNHRVWSCIMHAHMDREEAESDAT